MSRENFIIMYFTCIHTYESSIVISSNFKRNLSADINLVKPSINLVELFSDSTCTFTQRRLRHDSRRKYIAFFLSSSSIVFITSSIASPPHREGYK